MEQNAHWSIQQCFQRCNGTVDKHRVWSSRKSSCSSRTYFQELGTMSGWRESSMQLLLPANTWQTILNLMTCQALHNVQWKLHVDENSLCCWNIIHLSSQINKRKVSNYRNISSTELKIYTLSTWLSLLKCEALNMNRTCLYSQMLVRSGHTWFLKHWLL